MKIGIIGCGLIGQKRVQTLSGHELIAVSDLDGARASAMADRYRAAVYAEWRDVLNVGVDAVLVATTHDALGPISLAAVEAGKHVFVEKPGAISVDQAKAVAAAARRNRCIVKVGFNHRFHPAMLKAREIVDSGALGELMMIRGRYGHGGRLGYEQEWRCDRARSGGGELIDQGIHLIDLSRWFLGDLSLEYACLPTLFWRTDVDDNCLLALRGRGSSIAWLHASWTEWKNLFSLEIYGRQGKLHAEGLGGSYGTERLTHYRMRRELGPPETVCWEYPFPDHSWQLEFEDFVSSISTGVAPCGSIDDAIAVLTLIEQAYARGVQ